MDRLIQRSVHLDGRELIFTEGERCGVVHVLLSGWACRFKAVSGADRQILAFMIPGDHSALHSSLGEVMTHSFCALTPCEVAEIDGPELAALLQARPNLERAFRRSSVTDEAVLQAWLANVGRRPAERRMAHLLCELLARHQAIGLGAANTFQLPLTQSTLGDALGLSPAHVNRTLQALRARDWVIFSNGEVGLANIAKMQKFAGFNPSYLGLNTVGRASPLSPAG